MQQFELNRQAQERLLACIERNNAPPKNGPISLQEFVRLNPATFCSSTEPLDVDDWLCDNAYEMQSSNVAPTNYITFASYHLKGVATSWWQNYVNM